MKDYMKINYMKNYMKDEKLYDCLNQNLVSLERICQIKTSNGLYYGEKFYKKILRTNY